jgi:hypothetical protein
MAKGPTFVTNTTELFADWDTCQGDCETYATALSPPGDGKRRVLWDNAEKFNEALTTERNSLMQSVS